MPLLGREMADKVQVLPWEVLVDEKVAQPASAGG